MSDGSDWELPPSDSDDGHAPPPRPNVIAPSAVRVRPGMKRRRGGGRPPGIYGTAQVRSHRDGVLAAAGVAVPERAPRPCALSLVSNPRGDKRASAAAGLAPLVPISDQVFLQS